MTGYLHVIHNEVMAEWKKRAKINNEVIYFPIINESVSHSAPEVYAWDVDKTYLDTKFETFRGLVRTATEKANQKKNIPGSAKLVQSIQEFWREKFTNMVFPIFFITASPPQMERKIIEKLRLDGIRPWGIYCKDNFKNLRPRKFWRLNKHVGYKLQALLQMRSLLSTDVKIVLFGDDGESDSIIYSLFSDICSRRLDSSELRKVLNFFHVLDDEVDRLFRLQDDIPTNDPVDKIYINLAEDTDADYYLKFGRRTLPTWNSLQVALDLFQDQRLSARHVLTVADNLIRDYQYSSEEIEKSVDDLVRRQRLSDLCCQEIIPLLKSQKLISSSFHPAIKPRAVTEYADKRVRCLEGVFDPWVPHHIEYTHEYR